MYFIKNVLMNGYLIHCKEAEAIDIFDKMVSKGCVPNNVTYEKLIKQVRKAGRVKQSVKPLNDMTPG